MPLSTWELLIIAIVVLVLFGSKKMPDAARSMGRSLRIFKAETKGLINEDEPKDPQAEARAEAARLRAEADKLEREQAGPQQLPAGSADGTTLNGVPLPKPDQAPHGR